MANRYGEEGGMISPKENYLIAARGGKPLWVPDMWEDTTTISFNKYMHHTDETGLEWDSFGVSYANGFPTAHKFWDDVTDWRKYRFPNLAEIDWDEEQRFFRETCDSSKVTTAHVGDGGFMLILANALGFVDALVALVEEEDELLEFFAYVSEYAQECIDYAHKYLKADVISFPDDSSNGRGPFMSRETYRKLFAPFMKEACDRAHSHNMVFNVHNCGDPQFILDEYLDMGVDVVNACIDSPYLQDFRAKHGTKLALEAGWKNTGDFAAPDATEEAVKRAVDEYYAKFAGAGGFIAHGNVITPMGDKQLMKRKVGWLQEESNRIRFEYYDKKASDQLEYLSQYTHGMDGMWAVMGIKDEG